MNNLLSRVFSSFGLIILIVVSCFTSNVSAELQALNSGTTQSLFAIHFTDQNTGYAAGVGGTIIKTTDGGNNWFPLTSGSASILRSIYFVDQNTGYIVGDGAILKTTNAGTTWTLSNGGQLRSVYFENALTGYVVGTMSSASKTTNGGITWLPMNTPTNNELLTSVHFNNGKGFIGIDGNTNLLTSTDAGTTWSDSKIRVGNVLTKGMDFSGNKGVVVGYEGVGSSIHPVIFKSENNGSNWTEINSPSIGLLWSVCIAPGNSNIIYAVGSYEDDPTFGNKGLILLSTDGGNSWAESQWGTGTTFLSGVSIQGTTCFISGRNGLILKTTVPIGITPIGTQVPSNFKLNQNYPNPFNPVTNIEFSLPKESKVKLTVFDITGKTVEVLFNGSLNAGSYKYDFNAQNLTSGVYFYRLETDKFVETKKMMLVK